ncbi:AI-2E family transporter [Candidatus Thiothrix sp. Deng01]|uniref:AI-2E family transporter n=1 Tax=Candidatus Thiothrix phosphatis TaxID=3112415 RepID=A0ABU6CVQ0_9GAMM|nr:AI-2E family transporter [Candidatus Thiothrix sp. Deng01]MEB4590870.1 AI-2E family transporter [Candidatus Thiothrix sp. Deng01]
MLENGRWFWLVVGGVSLALLMLLAPILTPFLVGAFLAYLGDPLADRLESWGLSRTLSVSVVFLATFLLILLFFLFLLPVLETQVKLFVSMVPRYLDWGVNVLGPYLHAKFDVDPSVLEVDRLKDLVTSHWKETGGFIRNAIQAISKSGFVVLGWVANLALIPIITFYLLRDWDRMVAYIDDLLPRSVEPLVAKLARESDEVLGAFLRGQLLVMLALACIYALGLWLVGLEFALLIGLVAGLVSFVPYLGLIVGVSIAGVAVLFQTQDVFHLFWVMVVFGVAQVIEGTVLTPLLVGERIGLHPVTVIFSVLAGGQLFGFFGVLLALPVAAVLAVIMRHIHATYKQSHIYGTDAPAPPPLVGPEIRNGEDID